MAHLIDKDALVAYIRSRLHPVVVPHGTNYDDWDNGADNERLDILSFIDTLEVKGADLEKEPASEDLEKELKYYCHDYYNCDYPKQIEEGNCSEVMPHIVSAAKHFAQWQKEQMMKGAIEGRLGSTVTGSEQYVSAYVGYGEYGKDGDKVKVIIIKE